MVVPFLQPDRGGHIHFAAGLVQQMRLELAIEEIVCGALVDDISAWRHYDACALIKQGARLPDLLVDQGTADNFLETQLKTHLLDEACSKADIPATIRLQQGYDHSYFFISTFMAEHVAWHAERLKK